MAKAISADFRRRPRPNRQRLTARAGGVAAVRRACGRIPDAEWGGFQLYYPIPEKELDAMPGGEIVAAVLAIFDEVAPAMNLVQSAPCVKMTPDPIFRPRA